MRTWSSLRMTKIKCTAISDTHTMHDKLNLKSGGDILIHSGDHSFLGQPDEVYPFMDWLAKQPYQYKVFIAGNHDMGWEPIGEGIKCDKDGYFVFRGRIFRKGLEKEYRSYAENLDLIYLHNEELLFQGLRIYGSPYQPEFCGWAFGTNSEKAYDIASEIPINVDILVTHGPPYGIRDEVIRRSIWDGRDPRTGCEALKHYVCTYKPKYHVFGHIHESYGKSKRKHTTFINAASVGRDYETLNKPINFYINN
jgi:hypothetical protein